MKNSFVKNTLIAILLVALVGLMVIGCEVEDTSHTHEYTEVVTKAPTCTEQGVNTFTCSCGDSYTEALEMLPHTEVVDAAVAPGCENTGLTEGKHCSTCNKVLVAQETVAALGHDYGEGVVTTNPTCTDKGVMTYTCNNDATHTRTEEIDALGHADADPKDHNCDACGTKLSDCAAGENSHNCAICGAKLSNCVAGAPVVENATSATCGEAGSYDEVVYCTVCGVELNRTAHTVDALPHSYEVTSTTLATCESAGSKTLTCSSCGDTKTEEIKALGHNLTTYEAKAPTCIAIGWNAYETCSKCDYTTYVELPKTTSHNDKEEVTAPDCLNGGYSTFTCLDCGRSYTGKQTEALGHKENGVVTSPDCVNGGYTTYTCTVCGNVRVGDEKSALGHTPETVAGQAATCDKTGLTDGKKCSVCNVTLEEQEKIPATGHNYDSNLVCTLCGLDTNVFRLPNGGFENGLEGWTVVGNIGTVSTNPEYWKGPFGMDGSMMFSAYEGGAEEAAVGTLTSSTFKIGGSGFVTFKVGAMKDGNYVYVDVVDAETKQILARYYNGLWEGTDCTLVAYKADLSAFMGKEVFFRISDNADSGYGLFFADSFETYYENEPEGFNAATPVSYALPGTIYDIFNGSFEMGADQGWWNHQGAPGVVTGADAFFTGVNYGKHGNFLYSGVEDFMAGNGREGNTGKFTSSVFEIGGSGYITYMLGGGNDLCYIQIIDAATGEVLARYRQQAREDAVLKSYVADLSAYIGRTVRVQLVDNATNDWGCVSFDNVVTYYSSKPEGYIDAIDVKYEIVNGSFEEGLKGWNMNIWEAGAHNTLGWVESSEHDADWYTKNDGRKDGSNLFTFCRPDGVNCENTKGELVSSTFVLKQNSFVSFRFGGAGTREVRLELVKADGTVIAVFYNEAPGKINTEMFAYYYQYTGEDAECFFRVVDDSVANYGCFVVDDFRVNLASAPEGFIPAIQ